MSTLAIFLYGVFVFAIVAGALALVVYGIVADRRGRREQDSGAIGDPA